MARSACTRASLLSWGPAPGSVPHDGDFDIEVVAVGPGVALVVVTRDGVVAEDRLLVAGSGIDRLPRVGEQVDITDVDHLKFISHVNIERLGDREDTNGVAVADLGRILGRCDGQETRGGEELGNVLLDCDRSVQVRHCFNHVERVGKRWKRYTRRAEQDVVS